MFALTRDNRRLALLPALLCLLLPLSGCKGSQAEEPVAPAQRVTNVTVARVAAEDLQERFTLPGTLEAWEDLTLAAELAGPVRWLGPREGERVHKGEPLLRIDPEGVEADLARCQAEYALQQRQLERMQQLVGPGYVSRQEHEQTRRAFEVAEAELRRARLEVDRSTLRSPVDGIVDCWLVDRGEYVAAGTPVATLVQVERLKVLMEVPEKDVLFLKTGDPATVLPAAITGAALPQRSGEIIHLAYKAAPLTRTYLAKVAVDNPAGELRPGMIVRVGLTRKQHEGVIAVPLFAVVERAGEKLVFVAEDGVARRRPVTLGAVIGDRVVIDGGLQEGERLIVQGQQLISDGALVAENGG